MPGNTTALLALYVETPSYATKALAVAGQASKPAGLVIVTADESKDGGATMYFWTGTAFRWVATVEDDG